MLEVLALVAAVVAAACSVVAAVFAVRGLRLLRETRVELVAKSDQLDRANDSIGAANAALNQLAMNVQHVSVQAANAAVLNQQHYEDVVRAVTAVSDKTDGARREMTQRLDANRDAVEGRLDKMRETVDRQLDTIRATVDEKLAQTLNDRLGASFKQVSDQLEAVYRGLGDMQNIAQGVGDLKRVLTNVKMRGILGEVQLGAILREIMAPEQYEENVATKPGSSERVEYAVKLPVEGGDCVWLPIDSKFPGDTYERLRAAMDAGDADGIAAARRALEQVIKREAKDISEKYLSVPATTNFGIMFLPFEGLYAEVVDRPGLIEELQRDYQVNIAGPSTMAALLNSLQMSYQTFAFQRRADEIQKVLAAVKAELPKYQAELRRARKQIETAGRTVDGIINTRTNVLERKLRSVTALEDHAEAAELLGFADADDEVVFDDGGEL